MVLQAQWVPAACPEREDGPVLLVLRAPGGTMANQAPRALRVL